jgi:hypothetical protein
MLEATREGGTSVVRERLGGGARLFGGRGEVLPQRFDDPLAFGHQLLALPGPAVGEGAQHAGKAGPVGTILRRKIRAAEKRFQVGREPHAHRPAAAPGHGLHVGHVNAVHVGPFLAVDFDGDEMRVQQRGDLRVLERLVRHHVTPVAGRVTDGEEDGFLLRARPGEGLLAPREPIDRIVRVLAEVGRLFLRETIGHGSKKSGKTQNAKSLEPQPAPPPPSSTAYRCHLLGDNSVPRWRGISSSTTRASRVSCLRRRSPCGAR